VQLTDPKKPKREVAGQKLLLANLLVKVPQPGDIEVTFSVVESSCHLLLPVYKRLSRKRVYRGGGGQEERGGSSNAEVRTDAKKNLGFFEI